MPRSIKSRAAGIAAQPRSIVHGRAMELARALVDQANAWRPEKDAISKWLSITDGLDVRIAERRDGTGLDVTTNRGRVRVKGEMRIEPDGVDRSAVTIDLEIGPAGIGGRLLWWVAERLKFFDEDVSFDDPIPADLIEKLGAPESEWAEVRAEMADIARSRIAI